jgi:4-carboxymuconolactone decarboxylase
MAISEFAKKYHEKMFPDSVSELSKTDPEFIELFDNFAFDEVIRMPLAEGQERMDDRTRFMAYLAVLIGCQGIDEFRCMLPAALNMGVMPVEIKEIVYQATAYLGIGRVFPFLKAVNHFFRERGIPLPLEGQATVTAQSRREAGTQAQVEIFGEEMRDFWQSGPEDSRHIHLWLAQNCFGDYYTRTGLDYRQREMITFCFILAQGGCEAQLLGHARGNMNVGNYEAFLIQLISQCLPFIGYPRTLNALAVIRQTTEF